MAPEFSQETVRAIVIAFVGYIFVVGAVIGAVGWIVGNAFPGLRHVAPLATAGLATVALAPRSSAGKLPVVVWVGMGAVVTVARLLGDLGARGQRRDDAGGERPPPGTADG